MQTIRGEKKIVNSRVSVPVGYAEIWRMQIFFGKAVFIFFDGHEKKPKMYVQKIEEQPLTGVF